jgi:transposase
MLTDNINAILKLQGDNAVNVGIDMGNSIWVVTCSFYRDGTKSLHRFTGPELEEECYKMIGDLVMTGHQVHVVYEAGRNGFSPARIIMNSCKAAVTIIPVSRLEVVQCGKQAKTDRLDSSFLAGLDPRVMKIPSVWIPEIDQECRRTMLREKKRIEMDIRRNNNRIISIIKRWPETGRPVHGTAAQWRGVLQEWSKKQTCAIPVQERRVIVNMVEELNTFEKNLRRWEKELLKEEEKQRKEAAERKEYAVIDVLSQFRGISTEISRAMAWYIGDFKRFGNAKQFASYLGLTPTPYSSGKMNREQGISKKGNTELRRLIIQLAWLWRKWQPDSILTKKWGEKLKKKGRERKTAIVALARQLCTALFRLIVHGETLEGTVINQPLPQAA